MSVHETARFNMIEHQLRPNKVTNERVLAAFDRIRRELFVPETLRGIAYVDEDLPLGGGRYLMEPVVAARLLQAAAFERTQTGLVVGAGSGYEAAVMALLGRGVIALEEDLELARRARAALVEHGIAAASVVEGPLLQGWRARAPYDVILFGGAVAGVPAAIADQLAEGGRLLAVIRPADGEVGAPARSEIAREWGRALLMTRHDGVFGRRFLFDAALRALPGFAARPAFAL